MSRLGFGSNGPLGPTVLAQSAVAVSHTGDTLETTLATITIPAGAMGASGQIEIAAVFSHTNSANNKTFRVRFGGTTMASAVGTAAASLKAEALVANRTASSQVSYPALNGSGTSATAPVTTAIDTSAAVSLTITVQLALGTETVTLESYQVVLHPKA